MDQYTRELTADDPVDEYHLARAIHRSDHYDQQCERKLDTRWKNEQEYPLMELMDDWMMTFEDRRKLLMEKDAYGDRVHSASACSDICCVQIKKWISSGQRIRKEYHACLIAARHIGVIKMIVTLGIVDWKMVMRIGCDKEIMPLIKLAIASGAFSWNLCYAEATTRKDKFIMGLMVAYNADTCDTVACIPLGIVSGLPRRRAILSELSMAHGDDVHTEIIHDSRICTGVCCGIKEAIARSGWISTSQNDLASAAHHVPVLQMAVANGAHWDDILPTACAKELSMAIKLAIANGAFSWGHGFEYACYHSRKNPMLWMLSYGISYRSARLGLDKFIDDDDVEFVKLLADNKLFPGLKLIIKVDPSGKKTYKLRGVD